MQTASNEDNKIHDKASGRIALELTVINSNHITLEIQHRFEYQNLLFDFNKFLLCETIISGWNESVDDSLARCNCHNGIYINLTRVAGR